MRQLLAAGASVQHRNRMGLTALHHAAVGDQTPAARLLLGAGASAQLRDRQGYTPLMYASVTGNIKQLELYLKAGASPNTRAISGATAWTLAAERYSGPDEQERKKQIRDLLEQHGAHKRPWRSG